jgi:hypothetical protein
MKRTGRQSKNVHIQTAKEREIAKAGVMLDAKTRANPRTINEGEPIAYAEKTRTDRALGAVNNPGRRPTIQTGAEKRGMKDPAPQKFTQGNDNYTEVPFFKHTIKGKDC